MLKYKRYVKYHTFSGLYFELDGKGPCRLGGIAVSVIVPIYNVAPWLEECLISLEKQTLKNIEVILVNDGSTDSSGSIAQRYAEKNSNFTLINRENGGLSAARNAGLYRAKGEYVYFLDSDDYLREDALQTLYTKASHDNLDVLKFSAYTFMDGCGDFHWSSDDGYRYRGSYPGVYRGMDALQMFLDNGEVFPSCCLIFIRREIIEQNVLRFYEGIIHEDNLFHYQIMALSERTAVYNQPLYYRRMREGSIMSMPDYRHRHRSWCIIIREVDSFAEEHPAIKGTTSDEFFLFFARRLLSNWEFIPPEMKDSAECRRCLQEIEPILKKHNYGGSFRIGVFFLCPNVYKLYRWSASIAKRILRR